MHASSLPALILRHARDVVVDLLVCLSFYTRLPIAPLRIEDGSWKPGALGRALRCAPLAGVVVGALSALALATALDLLGLPNPIAAILAVGTAILVSGALHEDGLSDVADGFGGGTDRRRKLEIMRDSRIGTFGALALILSVALRVACVMALLDRYGLPGTALVLPAAAAASRGFGLLPLATLRPARSDGLGEAAGLLPPASLAMALALSVFLGTTLAYAGGLVEPRALAACGAAFLASVGMSRLAFRHIGGQTGDVAGATQQVAEIAYLVALLVAPDAA